MTMCKKKRIKIEFLGRSAYEVTQSCYKITTENHTLLLDFGLYQGADIVTNYKVNHHRIKGLRPKEIDSILISHANIDHCGALPWLYAHGCTAPVYIPKGNKELIMIMLYDSAKIMAADALKLTKNHINATPLYTNEDVEKLGSFFVECDFGNVVRLDDEISFKMIPAGHIVNSSQIMLYFRDGEMTKRLAYTGDIGSPCIERPYVEPYQLPEYADVLIGECTYSAEARSHKPRDREKDLEKIRTIVQNVCIEHHSKVLFPVFSLDRLQTILTVLYQMYGQNPEFSIPIVIDTPLGEKIIRLWDSIISKDQLLWKDVMQWNNIVFSDSWASSVSWQASDRPCIVLASSGMCTAGRSIAWCRCLLPDANAHICFCGYSSEESLAQKIKDGKAHKWIEVENTSVRNRCGITSLFSFSSHACRSELLDLYGNRLNYGTLCLVHSDYNSKVEFSDAVRKRLAENGKSSRVVAVQDGYSITM